MSPAHSQIHQLAAKRLLEHPVLHSILSCQRSPCTDKNDKTCWMSKPGDCYNIATQTTHGCRETNRHRVAVEACVYRATGRCWTVPKIGQLPLKLAGIHSDFRFQGQPPKTNQSLWFLVLSALVWHLFGKVKTACLGVQDKTTCFFGYVQKQPHCLYSHFITSSHSPWFMENLQFKRKVLQSKHGDFVFKKTKNL